MNNLRKERIEMETLCGYCEHSHDVYETVCKESRQKKIKTNGFIIVVECTGFDARRNHEEVVNGND